MTGPVLVGRDAAVAVVRAELDRTITSHGGVVMLAGEAGIGKTRLARQVAEEALDRDVIVAVASSWDGAGAPGYWPWIQLVRGLQRAASSDEWSEASAAAGEALSYLVGDQTSTPSAALAADIRFRLADAVTTLLVTLARHRPVVVVLDDLHWADVATVELLTFVARHAWFEQVLIVGTYRDVEVASVDHPLHTALESVAANATMVPLTGLATDDVRALLERVTGTEPDDAFVQHVQRRTGGNPFFIEQTARLHASDGPTDAIPPGIRATLDERLGRLPAHVQQLLALAAVVGREFDPRVLGAASERDAQTVEASLATALTARLVTKLSPDRFAFVHDLVRESLLFEMSEVDRRQHHAAVVAGWRRLVADGRPALPSVLARHAQLAVPDVPAADAFTYALAAVEDACARLAAGEMADLLRGALQLPVEVDDRRRAELQLDLASAERAAGELTAARQTFEQVVEAARSLEDAHLLAHAVLGLHELGIPDPDRDGASELALVDEAHASLADSEVEPCDPIAVRVLAASSRIRTHVGVEPDVATDASARALELARQCGDEDVLGFALLARHDVIWAPETVAERRELADEMTRVAYRSGDEELGLQASLLRFVTMIEQGDAAVFDELASLEARAEVARSPRFVFLARSRRGALATLTASFDRAREAIDGAFALGEELGEVDRFRLWLEQRWLVALLAGNDAEIDQFLARYRQLRTDDWYALPWVFTSSWRSDAAAVRRIAPAVPVDVETYPGPFGAVRLCLLVELAIAEDDAAARAAVRGELEPLREQWAVVAGAGAVYGPFSFWLGRLDMADEQWGAAVEHFAHARAAADTLGARAWSLVTGASLAQARLSRGMSTDLAAAAKLAAEVAEAAQALGMQSVSEQTQSVLASVRERDIQADGEAETAATSASTKAPASKAVEGADQRTADPDRTDGDPSSADEASASDRGEFRFDGHLWHLGFAGRTVQVPDAKGLRDLHALMGLPGQDVSVADLVDPASGEAVRTSARLGGDVVLDERAKAEYRQRLTDLGEQIEAALARGNDDAAAKLDTERAALLDELRRATGLGGRSRRLGEEIERARKTVTARIRDTLRRLDDRHPELAEHLRASVSTGTACRYQPAREIHWQR